MRILMPFLLLALPGLASAETVIAARTIRAQEVVAPGDLVVQDIEVPGAIRSLEGLFGLETRQALYAGRPLRPGDLGPPALVERNQLVSLIYDRNGLTIVTEARSLGRAGLGESLRVMNMASRQVVRGVVRDDGTVVVK